MEVKKKPSKKLLEKFPNLYSEEVEYLSLEWADNLIISACQKMITDGIFGKKHKDKKIVIFDKRNNAFNLQAIDENLRGPQLIDGRWVDIDEGEKMTIDENKFLDIYYNKNYIFIVRCGLHFEVLIKKIKKKPAVRKAKKKS